MTKNEFIQKATIAGIEAGKHPSIAVRDAQFAANELEREGQYFQIDWNVVVAPNPNQIPLYPCPTPYTAFPTIV